MSYNFAVFKNYGEEGLCPNYRTAAKVEDVLWEGQLRLKL